MTERAEDRNSSGVAPLPPVGEVSGWACQAYVEHLEREIDGVIGREPKNVARAAVLLYDLCRVTGHAEEAAYLEQVFDRPGIVLFQLSVLLRSVQPALLGSPDAALHEAAVQVGDLLRLVLLALEGVDDPAIVDALFDLHDSLEEAERSGRPEAFASSVNHLTQHINDFFFDRLTALPALREYVVSVELGLPPAMGPS